VTSVIKSGGPLCVMLLVGEVALADMVLEDEVQIVR
jgi:hypothetical protein